MKNRPLGLIIHAPTRDALHRARRHVVSLRKARPDAEVRLVVNGAGLEEMLANPDPETDPCTVCCGSTLRALGREAGTRRVTPAAVVLIAELQADGWSYIRA